MEEHSKLNIRLVEERPEDAWVDFSLKELRTGPVLYYKVRDLNQLDWLFKVCVDGGGGRVTVRAVKCPPGRVWAQLEGDSMLFQRSLVEGLLYDPISQGYVDETGRVKRRVLQNLGEIPPEIREGFKVVSYSEATGKKLRGPDRPVTLIGVGDYRAALTLFLLERAAPLTPTQPPPEKADVERGEKVGGRLTRDERRVLSLIRRCATASLEEVSELALRRFSLGREAVLGVVAFLEEKGKVTWAGDGRLKG